MFDVLHKKGILQEPDASDLKSIVKLHKRAHTIPGELGSVDCCHTVWKNYPMAWQGSFKGKQKVPTIVIEALPDYHMWFWYATYGYAGTLNGINMHDLSTFIEDMCNRRLENETFDRCFMLVDGIYPEYGRFTKGYKHPITESERKYTKWR